MAHRMKIGIFPSLQVFWSTFFCRGRLIGRVGWLSSSFYPNDTDMYQSPLEWNIELTNWVGRHDHPLAEDESKKEEEESAILLQLGLLLATAATTTWNRVTQPQQANDIDLPIFSICSLPLTPIVQQTLSSFSLLFSFFLYISISFFFFFYSPCLFLPLVLLLRLLSFV